MRHCSKVNLNSPSKQRVRISLLDLIRCPPLKSELQQSLSVFVCRLSLSPPQTPLQKLLFSATLTQNPEKLQQLDLHQPRLFSSTHSRADSAAPADRFDFPRGLTVRDERGDADGMERSDLLTTSWLWFQEFYVPCTLSRKPLLILHFILRMKLSPVLCFTNSREAAHRLDVCER